jgi:membrane associated rhomboid family serine protease
MRVFGDVGYMLPVWLTPLSSAFLHGGILHVSLNMLMLLMVGANLERVLGSKSFAILYGAGIVCAAAARSCGAPAVTPAGGRCQRRDLGAVRSAYAAFSAQPSKGLGCCPGQADPRCCNCLSHGSRST